MESQLRQAFARKHDDGGLTQKALADKLDIDKSVVNRRLTGRSNMTLETLADMTWGLGHCVEVKIYDPLDLDSNGFRIVPAHQNYDVEKPVNTAQFQVRTNVTSGAASAAKEHLVKVQ